MARNRNSIENYFQSNRPSTFRPQTTVISIDQPRNDARYENMNNYMEYENDEMSMLARQMRNTSYMESQYLGDWNNSGGNFEHNQSRNVNNSNRREFGNMDVDADLYRNTQSNKNTVQFGKMPNMNVAVRPHPNIFRPYWNNQRTETPSFSKIASPFGGGNTRENVPKQISNTPSGDLTSPIRQTRLTPSGQGKLSAKEVGNGSRISHPVSTFVGNQNSQSKINQDDVVKSAAVQSPRTAVDNVNKSTTAFDKQKNIFAAGMRVFTGPVDKVIKWHKILQEICVDHIFEVIARCISIKTGNGCEKHILVRDSSGPVLQVIFYEIDFLLPEIKVGSSVRVMGKMIGNNRMKAFKVREVVAFEEAALPRVCAIGHHMVAKLHSSFNSTN